MLLLKADTKFDKKIRTAIGKLEGQDKKKFDAEVKKRLDKWIADSIAGKMQFSYDLLQSPNVPPEYRKKLDRIKATIEKEVDYPGLSKLTTTKDIIFNDETDKEGNVVDSDWDDELNLNMLDVTMDFDDVVSKTRLKKLWKEETAKADKKFPTIPTEKKVSESRIGRRKTISLSDVLAPYTKEKLANPEKPDAKKYPKPVEPKEPKKPGKKAEESKVEEYEKAMKEYQKELTAYNKAKGLFDNAWNSYDDAVEERKRKRQQLKEEKANWKEYVESFGDEYPEHLEHDVEHGEDDEENNKIAVQDFEDKLMSILKNPKAYDPKKVKQQWEDHKLAELVAKNPKIKKLFEEIKQEQLSPKPEQIEARKKRIEKAVFQLQNPGRTVVSPKSAIDEWITDSKMEREFIKSKRANETEIKLEGEAPNFEELVKSLYDKEQVTHLKRRRITAIIGSEDKAITIIKRHIQKRFGVKGVDIDREGKDIKITFSEKTRSRQESISKVKKALNLMVKGVAIRKAVDAYEEIPQQTRNMLRQLIFKGKTLPPNFANLTDLFLTSDSKWQGNTWSDPQTRADSEDTPIDMMTDLMEHAGEDKVKPPKKISEMDVGRRKKKFLALEKDKHLLDFTFDIDNILGETTEPRAVYDLISHTGMTLSKVKENLVYAEDKIEDNLEDDEPPEESVAILQSVATIVAFHNVVSQYEMSTGSRQGRVANLAKGLEDIKRHVSKLERDLEETEAKNMRALQAGGKLDEGTGPAIQAEQRTLIEGSEKELNQILQDFTDAKKSILNTEPKETSETPFKGALKQALLEHARILEFNLDEAIENEENNVAEKYKKTVSDQVEKFDEEFKKVLDKYDGLVKEVEEF